MTNIPFTIYTSLISILEKSHFYFREVSFLFYSKGFQQKLSIFRIQAVKYLKSKLKKEGSELSEKTGQLKLEVEDGEMRVADVADTEQIFRLIQSIPVVRSI